MAIFSGQDKDLPVLTRLYQASVPTNVEDEPDLLLGSEIESLMGEHLVLGDNYSEEDKIILYADQIRTLSQLVDMRRVVVELLEGVADSHTLPLWIISVLNGWAKEYLTPVIWAFPDWLFELPEDNEKRVDVREVAWSTPGRTPNAIFKEVAEEAMRVASGLALVDRCTDCNNPFVITRGDAQLFCSHRCANRQGNRRRRQAIRESLKNAD